MTIHKTWLDDDSTDYIAVISDDDSDDSLPPRIVTVELEISDGTDIMRLSLTPTGNVEGYSFNVLAKLRSAVNFLEDELMRINQLPEKSFNNGSVDEDEQS